MERGREVNKREREREGTECDRKRASDSERERVSDSQALINRWRKKTYIS